MKSQRYYIFFFTCGLILAFCVIGIAAYLLFTPNNRSHTNTRVSTPTPGILRKIHYEPTSTQQMLDIVKSRPPLSARDRSARTAIVQKLNGTSGIIYKSSKLTLEYIKAADEFQGEITTDDVQIAKQEASTWLNSQGLSAHGICYLPLIFYINKKYLSTNIDFNPLPLGCTK